MLNQMRSGAGNLLAKILLGLLVISFAVWGIGDMLRKPHHNTEVAKVGDSTITKGALERALRQESENLRNQMGANYSPELLKAMHVPQQLLAKMINQTLARTESNKLGLIPSDSDILNRIAQNPGFHNSNGKFDKEVFINILRRNGLSEKDYVAQLRDAMATGLLLKNMSTPGVSDHMINIIYQALQEQRAVTVYTIPASSAGLAEPKEEDIENYYKQNSSRFSTHEMRTASYVSFKAEDVAKNIKPSEADLRAVYNDRIEEFKRQETRGVSQLLYDNEEAAKKASGLLQSGKTIEQVAKETGVKPVSMGALEKEKVPGDAADAVFALKAGESTGAIKSAFGWHVFQVSKIIPPRTLPFEEVRASLENDGKQRSAEEALAKLGNQIEDSLAAGSSLAEAARDAGLKVVTLPAIDASGKAANGLPVKEIPDFDKFLETVFKTDEKSESTLKTSKGGIYYLVRVETISPERVRPLAEIKSQVVEELKKSDRAKRIEELAKKIESEFADEKARAAAISKYNLLPSQATVKRGDDSKLPPMLVNQIFDKKPGSATGVFAARSGDYMIAVVKDIIPSKAVPGPEIRSNMRKNLEASMQSELAEEYMAYLRNKHSVYIDEEVLQSMTKE